MGTDGLGRKVFFLYPASVIREELLFRLLEQEYEVYSLKDHAACRLILERFPSSIVFVNIDEGLEEKEWEVYVREILSNPRTAGVGVGICSYHADDDLRRKYLMDIGASCGFVRLKLGLEESYRILLETLKANEAKGRRRYVRANCATDPLSLVNLRIGESLVNGKIKDISVVGFSCAFEQDPNLPKNALVEDLQLKLRGALLKAEAVVFGVRSEENPVYVFLFTQKLQGADRTKIRRYIQTALQAELEMEAVK